MSLSGTAWYNELGSVLKIDQVTFDEQQGSATFTGTYNSLVGRADGEYTTVGSFDPREDGITIGWTISWQNAKKQTYSLSAFCGRFNESKTAINTTWMLTEKKKNPKKEWKSTTIGCNYFTKDKPPKEIAEEPSDDSSKSPQ